MIKKAFAAVVAFSSLAIAAPQKVAIKTPDGVALNALFSKAAPGKPTVVMLHGLDSAKEEWNPLIDRLIKSGDGVLAYDSRRAGTPWPKLVDDVGAVVRYLDSRGVSKKDLVLAGASLGANVALKYAALTGTGRQVLLLSPGLDYQGLTTPDIIGRVTSPVLFVVSAADGYAFASCQQLHAMAPRTELWTDVKPGHGVQMFDDALLGRLVRWLEKRP